jgi:hypothetical protein
VAEPVNVFLSYAPADENWCAELERHLAGLERDGVIRPWSKQCIVAGDDRTKAVEAHLAGADIVLLLVSADYLASDYHYEVEMTTARARARAGDARVIPVLLRACYWTIAAFEGLTPLPPNRVPVNSWPNRDEAWTAVAQGIREAITGPAGPMEQASPQRAAPAESSKASAPPCAGALLEPPGSSPSPFSSVASVGGGHA